MINIYSYKMFLINAKYFEIKLSRDVAWGELLIEISCCFRKEK